MEYILDFLITMLIILQVLLPIYIYYIIFSVAEKQRFMVIGVAGLIMFILLKTNIYVPEPDSRWEDIISGISNVLMLSSIVIFLQKRLKQFNIDIPNIIDFINKR